MVRVFQGVAQCGGRGYENRNSTTGGGKRETVSAPTFHFLLPASRHMTPPTKTWLMALGVFPAYLLLAGFVYLPLPLYCPRPWSLGLTPGTPRPIIARL